MYVRVVTFRLEGIEPADYRAQAEQIAPALREWPGLISKTWLADGPDGRHGGVYLFVDEAAADASRGTEVFQGMAANRHFADLRIDEYAVLDGPTAITTLAV